MNNETNPDLEAFAQNFFDWLLEKSVEDVPSISVEDTNLNRTGEEFSQIDFDPLDSEELDDFVLEDSTLHPSGWGDQQGEVPIVSERFQVLLKQRFKQEIQQHPPRFPWEMNFLEDQWDYPETYPPRDGSGENLWTPQVRHLRWGLLPISMTEEVFARLLTSCQNLAFTSLGEGTKLIQAVQDLFPQDSERLNHLAGLVLHGALRTPDGEIPPYETATVDQKMLLSLLTAQEILKTLTLTCPLNQTPTERSWETTLGTVRVRAQYTDRLFSPTQCSLSIECEIPDRGILTMRGNQGKPPQFQRGTSEEILVMRVDGVEPDGFYTLTVDLCDHETLPLPFGIYPTLRLA